YHGGREPLRERLPVDKQQVHDEVRGKIDAQCGLDAEVKGDAEREPGEEQPAAEERDGEAELDEQREHRERARGERGAGECTPDRGGARDVRVVLQTPSVAETRSFRRVRAREKSLGLV